MDDYVLQSTWEEVDAAAQAVANGLQKSQLSQSVQTSLDHADSAYQSHFWVNITRSNNVYSSDKTLSEIQTAYAAGKYVRANLPDGFQSDFTNNDSGAMFYAFDDSGGSMTLMRYTVGASSVVFQSWPVGGQGITNDLKTALLNCFAHVAWDDANGQSRYDALEAALYPETHLVSITASYDQDHPIYDTDSLETVITTINYDLTVVANYSDGTTETLSSSDYTITGTVEAGASVPFTVAYEGKTATINVLILENSSPTYLYNWDLTTSLIDSVSSQEITLGAGSGKSAPTRGSGGLVFNDATQYAYLGNISLDGKTIEIDVDSFDFKGSTSNHIRFLMGQVATADNKGYGPIIWKTATGWTAYGQNSSNARTWSGGTYISGTSSDVINAFNGKTLKLVTSSDGFTHSLYLDDVLQGTLTDVKVQSHIVIGANMASVSQSNGDQCYDMTITGIRIYENEV